MDIQLSEGALATIMQGGDFKNPVVQVLSVKKMNPGLGQPEKDRYITFLSDGRYTVSFAMMTAPVYAKAGDKGLTKYSIMTIKKFITSVINTTEGRDSRVLLILDLEVLADGDDIKENIGNPEPYSEIDAKANGAQNGTFRTNSSSNISRNEVNRDIHTIQLSEGALATIMQGGDFKNPVVQVLSVKKMNTGSGQPEKDRYRAFLSDGRYTVSFAMMTAPVYAKAGDKGLTKYSIMTIKKFITSVINTTEGRDSRVLLILDLEVLADGDDIKENVGNREPYSEIAAKANGAQNGSFRTKSSSNISRNEVIMDIHTIQLSEGALATIMQGGDFKNPVVQVLSVKKMNTGSGQPEKDRYRAFLSDGRYTVSFAIMTAPIYAKAGDKGLTKYSIMTIKKFITSVINNTKGRDSRVLLILDLEVLADGDDIKEKIGNPEPYSEIAAKANEAQNGTFRTNSSSNISRNEVIMDIHTIQLSEGALATILQGGDFSNPVVQVLSVKKFNIDSGQPEKKRYWAILSDGRYCVGPVYASAGDKCLTKYSILKIKNRVLIIWDLEVLADGEDVKELKGNPEPYFERVIKA